MLEFSVLVPIREGCVAWGRGRFFAEQEWEPFAGPELEAFAGPELGADVELEMGTNAEMLDPNASWQRDRELNNDANHPYYVVDNLSDVGGR